MEGNNRECGEVCKCYEISQESKIDATAFRKLVEAIVVSNPEMQTSLNNNSSLISVMAKRWTKHFNPCFPRGHITCSINLLLYFLSVLMAMIFLF